MFKIDTKWDNIESIVTLIAIVILVGYFKNYWSFILMMNLKRIGSRSKNKKEV